MEDYNFCIEARFIARFMIDNLADAQNYQLPREGAEEKLEESEEKE